MRHQNLFLHFLGSGKLGLNVITVSALITLNLADITEQCDCDAIINSANKNIRAVSGVCGAIYDAAGPELEPYSIRLAPLALSESVITPGFGPCVCHGQYVEIAIPNGVSVTGIPKSVNLAMADSTYVSSYKLVNNSKILAKRELSTQVPEDKCSPNSKYSA